MTDTGQVPGEGLPESAGMVEQPGVPAHGAYTYLSEAPAEDEDLLLPGAQGAWGNEVPPPAPEPIVEAVHQPGPHETAGRDSGSVDLSGVRLPNPAPVSVPPSPILAAPHEATAAPHEATAAPQPQRRPLHLGPPIPDASASPVRSLADRGPAGAPVRQPAPATTGPEYLDAQPLREMAPQSAAPWGAAPAAVAQVGVEAPAAETVSPTGDAAPVADEPGAAQAAMTRLVTQAVAHVPGEEVQAQVVHGHDGMQPVHGHDGVYVTQGDPGQDPTGVPAPVEAGPDLQGAAVADAVAAAADGSAAEFVPPADAAVLAPEAAAAVQAAEVTAVDETGLVAPAADVADVAEQSAPVQAAQEGAVLVQVPDGAQAEEGAEPVLVSEPVQQAEHAEQAEPVQQAEPVPPVESAQIAAAVRAEVPPAVDAPVEVPAEGAPAQAATVAAEVATAAGVVEAVVGPEGVVEAVAAPEGIVEAVVASEGVVEAVVAPEGVAEAVAAPEGVVEAVVAPQGVAEAVEPAPVQPDPYASGTVEAQPAAVPGPAAHAAAEVQPVGAPLQAPGTVPAAQPVPAPEPAHAAESAQTTEPVAQAEPVSPAQDAVQPPLTGIGTPEAAEVSELPLLQAQGPQIAGPVQHDAHDTDLMTAPPQPQPQEAPHLAAAAPTPATGPDLPAGPQLQPAEPPPGPAVVPAADEAVTPSEPAGEADPAAEAGQPAAGGTADTLTPGVPPQQHPEQPLGQFVPVEGQVPTTPHLAPTPPHPLVLPVQEQQEPVVTVPAPREAEPAAVPATPDDEHAPDVVQQAEDLETRAADQEESTAAVEEPRQSTGPAAPAYDDAERAAVLKVMRERRDIRNGFRSDPIPHEVLLRVLEAAHTAPSVGHSQPWDFVVIRSADTRRSMHELAMRQRDAYAQSLPKGRAKQFKELKIEAILDTPVNIVVTADPTRGGRHTLGRHTQPQMAPYSAALAVENLWLAARAEGLGVGWVSFFDEREMVRALGLPEHLEVIAYLCVGYVDEFPDEPELMQAGWSKRRPLSWVVHEETYGRRALPGEEPHDLLAETVAQIRPLDAKALGEAWERQKRMTKPAGALGMLEIISAQLSGLSRQCPPPIPEPAAVAIFAGDHGVHAQGVTPWPQEVTAQMVANFLGGGAVCNAFAGQVGAEVCVVDVGVAADLPATPGLLPRKIRGGTSDMTTGPAMTREEAKAAIEVGIETARDLVAAGNKALLTGEMGIANTTASAALISVFTGAEPAEVTGRGTGINDETLARKTEVVRRALELHQPDPADPIGVLAAIGGFEHAALVGLLLGGASLRTPVILDGVSAGAAALVARAIAPEVLAACIAGHRSAEPGHVAALNKLGLRPLVDLDLRLGEGTGALLALPLVQSTARAMNEVATFDSAGVTEK
ncbi:nicotinate-nucleotide--dimethylbenzimidazole phosphoribosyltransferase [Streptomyces sp. NPDC101151]|uniref:nicotinate-nucleotide--dimethylbenzimidazole phosphoribosyltransferase n=1 Tax=Streptomyces sp. NPDC101151 TaxID=3366115 RepID=UPI0037F7C830